MLGIPEILGVAVAVVYGYGREVSRFYAVDYRVVIFFFHEYLVYPQYEVCAELRGYAVEIMVGLGITVELARFVVLRVVERIHPGAFEDLITFFYDLRIFALRIGFFSEPVLESENAVFHFFGWCIARESHAHCLFEVFALVVYKVYRALLAFENVLRGI